MVRIVTLQREYPIVVWLCPCHLAQTIAAKHWTVVGIKLVPWSGDLRCINHDAGGCTSAWVEAPAELAPPPAPPPPVVDAPAGVERREPPPPPKTAHPIGRDTRLRRLMELRRAGVPMSEALEQVEKETTK